ncbi:hypothetical protein ACF1HU_36325 [Streptomyces olivaceus]|uniref:hypothetical protein n=1 Tax=Streptomyces olivaceus TaxID=47716 RepID=UPI0004CB6278|nr:hypothetical protein [Streptomyces olivaceus]MBZ6107957.1 hypothetical protein [Streptomyces olivaceus]
MSNGENQDGSQPAPTPAPAGQPPAPEPDFVDAFTNQTMIGTDKESDNDTTLNKAVRPQRNTETR